MNSNHKHAHLYIKELEQEREKNPRYLPVPFRVSLTDELLSARQHEIWQFPLHGANGVVDINTKILEVKWDEWGGDMCFTLIVSATDEALEELRYDKPDQYRIQALASECELKATDDGKEYWHKSDPFGGYSWRIDERGRMCSRVFADAYPENPNKRF